ncbi:MAG: TM0106 family RecB-like putative nuclease [Planctomycetes bacterium]|nr:TM0106 family RecB-like putative nuclease [Planctomycetota bacterium]
MKRLNGTIHLSASDIVGHLNCNHLSALDVQVASGLLAKPDHYDPLLEILRERGYRHEQTYIEHLEARGYEITVIEGFDITEEAVEATIEAMRKGKSIITQGALRYNRWSGRADILRRVEIPSDFGDWSYEVIDTKLARETKGGTILQLSLYADLLTDMQGVAPVNIYVVAPWSDYEPQVFRVADYAAYFRRVKTAAEVAVDQGSDSITYPEPKDHCAICRWRNQCDQRRRDDDHLCLVANITKNQICELQANGITTTQALADMPIPIPFVPRKGSPVSIEKAKAQASIQVQAREAGELRYELLDFVQETGLAALPEPSTADVFFDIESDPFVGEHGLEYLFGCAYEDNQGAMRYTGEWAFNREEEKAVFERFVDFITERRETNPDMHIYHFAPYEQSALKRLMGRYATRENEIDNLLRGLVFVDLLSVVRNAMRASVESYSLKKLEPFFGFERKVSLHEANIALTRISAGLELNDIPSIGAETKTIVQDYNTDDCFATAALRDWLEGLRSQLVSQGKEILRPAPGQEGPSEELDEQARRIQELVTRLTHDVPVDPEVRTNEQQARWILAHILEWHRRENKAVWWEFFRLRDLTSNELVGERAAISRLSLINTVSLSPRGIPTDRYHFEQQDTDLRGDEDLKAVGGENFGKAVAVSTDARTIDVRKTAKTKDIHPEAVFAHTVFSSKEQAASLFRLGEYVAENGIEGEGSFKSARALLLREPPNLQGQEIQEDGESTLDAALRICHHLNAGILPIQGPPGTGKSHTGARMICSLVQQGKKVGITANSHKVIRNLIDKVIEAAAEMQINVSCVQKPKEMEPNQASLSFAKRNEDVFAAIAGGTAQVAGATHFLWSREDACDTLDVLVVDEAAQMSLANVLAVSPAAPTLILLGDPQQLEQPTQGSHPDGTDASALDHILGGQQTITKEQGLFLEKTFRLHPSICIFTSELFYDVKLTSEESCDRHEISSNGFLVGSGLRYLRIDHTGNTSSSIEEADAVKDLVERILAEDTQWTDRDGLTAPITLEDILIITPYNAQVFEIQQRLPRARAGTVDKFQGQEAPIAIYSMATSSHADAPRGMEFLYSSNRFNVAIARAKCMAILIASPGVFEADCRTPRQMQLANAFCRYLEMAPPL